MLANERPEREDINPGREGVEAPFAIRRPPFERHGYAPARKSKVFGFVGTCLFFGAVASAIFVTFEHHLNRLPPSAPLVVNLLPLKSPSETPPKPKEAPKAREKQEKRPVPQRLDPVEHPIIDIPTIASPSPAVKPADPVPPQPETAAPKTAPAPPAAQVSSNAPDTWEGRVLARLEKYRRYPSAARSARQQGVVYIRFRINRDGRLLSSLLVRSSGYPAIDKAAFEMLRRAEPLPKIPADRPDEIELAVPVKFYIR